MKKTLSKQYQDLEALVYEEFQRLILLKHYDFTKRILEAHSEEEHEAIQDFIQNSDYYSLEDGYELSEHLPQLYYNTARGDEKMAYLLSVDSNGDIYILDDENRIAFFIKYTDINLLTSKISMVELMQKENN